ncbi:hypothetical protein Tco_0410012 [Tanacetum coccineum]
MTAYNKHPLVMEWRWGMMMGWRRDGDDGGMMAVVGGGRKKKERGGEWGSGLGRSEEEETFLKLTGKLRRKINRVDVIDISCEEYVQEVLEISKSGNPTSISDLMIDSRSPSFTPFGGSDFLMEEIDEFLEQDDSIPPGVEGIYDSEGDTVYLEELLSVINSDPSLPLSPVCEINVPEKVKSLCEDPPDLELKDLPSHLEYAFLEGNDTLPVIIAKNLKDEDKTALIKVLKSHKQAIAWKISDIKGIDPQFCSHMILMEENAKPIVQHQRRVNPKIHEVIKQEVIKLLDAGLIYPISDSPWVSPVHCVPKKGGITVVKNEENELIPTRKGLQGQKEAKTVKNRQGTKETRTRVKKQPKIKAGSARHSQTQSKIEIKEVKSQKSSQGAIIVKSPKTKGLILKI